MDPPDTRSTAMVSNTPPPKPRPSVSLCSKLKRANRLCPLLPENPTDPDTPRPPRRSLNLNRPLVMRRAPPSPSISPTPPLNIVAPPRVPRPGRVIIRTALHPLRPWRTQATSTGIPSTRTLRLRLLPRLTVVWPLRRPIGDRGGRRKRKRISDGITPFRPRRRPPPCPDPRVRTSIAHEPPRSTSASWSARRVKLSSNHRLGESLRLLRLSASLTRVRRTSFLIMKEGGAVLLPIALVGVTRPILAKRRTHRVPLWPLRYPRRIKRCPDQRLSRNSRLIVVRRSRDRPPCALITKIPAPRATLESRSPSSSHHHQ